MKSDAMVFGKDLNDSHAHQAEPGSQKQGGI